MIVIRLRRAPALLAAVCLANAVFAGSITNGPGANDRTVYPEPNPIYAEPATGGTDIHATDQDAYGCAGYPLRTLAGASFEPYGYSEGSLSVWSGAPDPAVMAASINVLITLHDVHSRARAQVAPNVSGLPAGGCTIDGGGGWTTFADYAASWVPEPATMILIGAGLVGLGMCRRRR